MNSSFLNQWSWVLTPLQLSSVFPENSKFKIQSDVKLIEKDWFYNQNLLKVSLVSAMNQLYPFIIQFSTFKFYLS